jgi:hypothetical protein
MCRLGVPATAVADGRVKWFTDTNWLSRLIMTAAVAVSLLQRAVL